MAADDRSALTGPPATRPARETPASSSPGRVLIGALQPPERIGKYRILNLVGMGGMGVVYRAEQDWPRRIVALKVIKPGIASPLLLQRFEHEAHVLGRLQHTGIAHIFEAGTADTGAGPQPYFAMEFVEGQPLTDFALKNRLNIRERLQLFVAVCDAVQHAHAKGVIHRDLKPGNILVATAGTESPENDGANSATTAARSSLRHAGAASLVVQPKILDFGVARLTAADVKHGTIQTEVGQWLGTLPYMSPEQVAADPDELDTRSDIYTLGVILFELLGGALPYDVSRLPITEAARTIREVAPTRLVDLNRACRGDLETIVGAALQKEKERRYQTVFDLAGDVRRYLSNEPILARQPGAVYQLRKFAQRNKPVALAAIAVVASLLAGIITICWNYVEVSHQRDRAEAAQRTAQAERSEAVAARQAETEARDLAERRLHESEEARKQADAVTEFLSDMLRSVEPSKARGQSPTVREVLDRAAASLGGQFRDQPLVAAAVRNTIGYTYQSLGQFAAAAENFGAAFDLRRAALGDEHRDTLETANNLASALVFDNKVDEAVPIYRRTLELQTVTLGPDHEDTIAAINNLSHALQRQGAYAEAEPLAERAIAAALRVHGADHVFTLRSQNNLALLKQRLGKSDEAESLDRATLVARERLLGEDHPDTIVSMNNLALDLNALGRPKEAEPLFRRALALGERVFGETHQTTLILLDGLGATLKAQSQWEAAAAAYGQILERRVKSGASEGTLAPAQSAVGDCLTSAGRYDEAEPLLLQSYTTFWIERGPDHARTVEVLQRLVRLYECWDRPREADAWRARSITPP